MLGLAVTLLVCICASGVGAALVGRWTRSLDPALRLASNGLVGLGGLGTLTLLVGLLPGGFTWGLAVVAVYCLVGAAFLFKEWKHLPIQGSFPDGLDILFPVGAGLALLVSALGVLTPSTILDWDTLAYHLAVPKLYLQAGQITPLFIHQSNFPSVVDLLYVWGLKWGGENGAKGFSLFYFALGILAVYGFARQRYNARAAGWAMIAFAWVPVIVWESGTAYIDVANGVFAGLGILFAALFISEPEQKNRLWLAGVFLGFAAGSKYTGLQTIFAVGLTMVAFKRSVDGLKSACSVAAIALAVACPWYIKNVVYVGNPVYPFFYQQFGGKNWDLRRADIYAHEQHTFGIGRSDANDLKTIDPKTLGAAILGLEYQPGRYINPGQTEGLGTPLGSIGIPVVLGLFLWLISGRAKRFEGVILASSVISLLLWFDLSQQSRYIVPLALPLALLVGGGIKLLRVGYLLAAATVLQCVVTLWVMRVDLLQSEMRVFTGQVSEEDYRSDHIPFYKGAKAINQEVGNGKVALYDEVFGYLLDVPYMWANPGHSTLIPYDSMKTEADYIAAMKRLGFTHVYVYLRQMLGSEDRMQAWYASTGLGGPVTPMPDREAVLGNWQTKYQVLIADAIAAGDLIPVENFSNGSILLKIK
jgi:hypothetical protein